jgi:hypothetical protein
MTFDLDLIFPITRRRVSGTDAVEGYMSLECRNYR